MFVKRLTYNLLFLCVALVCHAQDSLLLRDYQFVKQQTPWLTSNNAAGLTRYNTNNIAEAEAAISYTSGGLRDYWQAANAIEANVLAEAFQRLSARTVVYGRISYHNFSGRQMAGSAFMHQDNARYPFDIVEDSTTNKGQKHSDNYQLTGAIGIEIWKGFSIGTRLDYIAANYAKYKDLRHSNKLMDFKVSAGATGHVLPQLTVGANYQYHRNTESVTFNTYGKEEKVYKSLIDYGAFMGRVEQFGSSGYTEKGREMPLVEDQHGVSLQIEWQPTQQWAFYNEFSIAHGDGYYGRKSPYTITFTNHERDILEYHGRLSYQTTAARHRLDMCIRSEKLVNNVETYRELTNANGAHYYEYYEAVKAGDKKWMDIRVGYTADLMIKGELPTWTLTANFESRQRKQTGTVYPYYRKQDLSITSAQLSGTRNIMLRKGILSATARLCYQKGSGSPFTDGLYQSPSKEDKTPPTMADWLYQEYRYLTASQFGLGADIKYAFILPKTKLNTFVKGSFSYNATSTSNDFTDGNNRLGLLLAIGCTF